MKNRVINYEKTIKIPYTFYWELLYGDFSLNKRHKKNSLNKLLLAKQKHIKRKKLRLKKGGVFYAADYVLMYQNLSRNIYSDLIW